MAARKGINKTSKSGDVRRLCLLRGSVSRSLPRDKRVSTHRLRETKQEVRAKCEQQLKVRDLGRYPNGATVLQSRVIKDSHAQPSMAGNYSQRPEEEQEVEAEQKLQEEEQPPLPMETVFIEAEVYQDVDEEVVDLKTELPDSIDIGDNDPPEGDLDPVQQAEPAPDFCLYMCEQCNKMFTSEVEVNRHISKQKEMYSCKLCHLVCCGFSRLSEHMVEHYGFRVVPCFYCELSFDDDEMFCEHMDNHSGCPVPEPSLLRLALEAKLGPQQTVRKEGAASLPQEIVCIDSQECQDILGLQADIKENSLFQPQESVHIDSEKCQEDILGLPADIKEDTLSQPQEIVHGDSEKCQNMNIQPITLSNETSGDQFHLDLDVDEKTDDVVRPVEPSCNFSLYVCEKCGRMFTTEVDVSRHLSEQKEMYSCKLCLSFFCDFSHLSDHMTQHNGRKVVPCYYCEMRFLDDEVFRTHMGTHCGDAHYVCPLSECGETFLLRTDLVNHMLGHKLVPYCCCRCDLVFATQEELLEHSHNHFQKIRDKCSS